MSNFLILFLKKKKKKKKIVLNLNVHSKYSIYFFKIDFNGFFKIINDKNLVKLRSQHMPTLENVYFYPDLVSVYPVKPTKYISCDYKSVKFVSPSKTHANCFKFILFLLFLFNKFYILLKISNFWFVNQYYLIIHYYYRQYGLIKLVVQELKF